MTFSQVTSIKSDSDLTTHQLSTSQVNPCLYIDFSPVALLLKTQTRHRDAGALPPSCLHLNFRFVKAIIFWLCLEENEGKLSGVTLEIYVTASKIMRVILISKLNLPTL